MEDEKLFQYLVSRVQVRETSTLTIATIASSASLILLGLYFSPVFLDEGMEQERIIIWWIGILSPIIGFSYFEITFYTQQSWDYNNIREIIYKESRRKKEELNKIIFGESRRWTIVKPVLWRVLLTLPIIGWLSLDLKLEWIIVIVVIVGIAISLLIKRIERNKDDIIAKEAQNDSSSQDENHQDSENS